MVKIAIFADVVSMLQSIGATHIFTKYSLHSQESAKTIDHGFEIEASIRASVITVLHYILVGNKKEATGSAYECLVGYIKDYSICHPHGAQGSLGLRTRIWEGTETVTGHLKRLRNTLTTDLELEELSINLATDSAALILEFIDFFTSQYEEYIETSTFPSE